MYFIVAVIFFFILLLMWYQSKLIKKTTFLERLPVPKSSLPFLGVALDFSSTKVMLDVMNNYNLNCGSVVLAQIGPFRQFILISDYKLLEQVLSSSHVLTKSDDYMFLHSWLGSGLLTSDGPKWKKHRRILTPAFHFQILELFIEVFEKCGNILIEKLRIISYSSDIDIYNYITLCSLDIICESIMGIKINAQADDNSDYLQSVRNMCRIVIERSVSPIETNKFLYFFTKNYWTEKQSLKKLHQQSNDVISARKQELETNLMENESSNDSMYYKNKKPFLDLLLQTKVDGRSLTQEEIRQEVDTFLFEGHDTTSSAVSFILYSLANNPDAQSKAFEEQNNIFQNRSNDTVTYADLQDMKYLEYVIKESLRLYPSVPFYGRQVTEDLHFGDDVIPKGISLVIYAFGIQRDPKYYENPEEFKPERFEKSDGKMPYAFIPFSAGPRNCIGQKFAMFEMKSIVSKILRNFELLPTKPEQKVQLIAETILKSSNGVHIGLKSRY